MAFDVNGFEADRKRRQRLLRLIWRFVQRRAVEPDDVLVVVVQLRVVVDLGRVVVSLSVVRCEMAVRDRVFVFVPRLRLVDVL